MSIIRMSFFIMGIIAIIIFGYFTMNQSEKAIITNAQKLISNRTNIQDISSTFDSLSKHYNHSSKIVAEIHDKRQYVLFYVYRKDTVLAEVRLPRTDTYQGITSNQIITIYLYTKEYLALRRFARSFDGSEYSLICIKDKIDGDSIANYLIKRFPGIKKVRDFPTNG
jgi:hypothetical protein